MKRIIALLLALTLMVSFAACGEKGPDVTGKYICVGESYGGEAYEEPYQESWIELKKGGKGTYYSGFEFDLKWKADGENFTGTVTFLGMEEAMEGTIKDGVMEVKYGDMNIRFVKEGMEAPVGGEPGTGTNNAGTAGVTGANDDVTVAATLSDAFLGAVPGGTGSGFVSPTTHIELGNMWFGTMMVTDFVGNDTEDYAKDIIASINTTSSGYDYFEVYTDSSMSDESVALSMYINLGYDSFTADIGYQDAWVFQRYLTEDDAVYFSPTLQNGALDMTYHYVDPNNEYSCTVRFFLREDGTEWDEENDPLPPSYDRYKEAIGG
ncbi:MAG: hypothetical protein ACI4NU_00045 [Christensenellales bacterium]